MVGRFDRAKTVVGGLLNNGNPWVTKIAQMKIFRFFGLGFNRSRSLIEVDITYQCNLKCFNCDRSCSQAPSDEMMSLEQIRGFISDSVDASHMWGGIRVLGGEPTIHPEILEFLDLLLQYKKDHNPDVALTLVTNGFGKKTKDILSRVPDEIVIENTQKSSRERVFDMFNLAPRDESGSSKRDYSRGCWVARDCGMGLTPWGYYPCAVAGGIDRVMGFDLGRKKLPDKEDDMRDLMRVFCSYCGHFNGRLPKESDVDIMSPTWVKAYEDYQKKKPKLKRIHC